MCNLRKVKLDLTAMKMQVKQCLHNWPATRNSDKELYIKVITEFYGITGRDYVTFDEIIILPSYDTISRCRRKIQEGKEYPPTDEKIALERGWLVDEWKKALGYFVESPGQKKFDFVS